MLRFDQCVCGTTTTGTGTLTLAATPTPPGGIDFDVWARATGIGFANSAAVLVDYEIIEYTDSTFATAKLSEGGIGTLTLGGSSGIANCTLARTTIDYTITSMNSQPATANVKPGTGITVGTAANVLVMISPRSLSVPGFEGYYESSLGDGNIGSTGLVTQPSASVGTVTPSATTDIYSPFIWLTPMLVKKCTVRVSGAGASNTGTVWGRLYALNTSGRPGKLLYDFGQIGGANAMQTIGNISSGAAGNGFLLTPGEYVFGFIVSSVTGTPTFTCQESSSNGAGHIVNGRTGFASLIPNVGWTATSGTAGAAPDPANVTGYAGSAKSVSFALGPS